MIERLVVFSAHHRFLVLAFAAAAALTGWRSLQHLPLDFLPDLGDTQVIIYSHWDRSPDLVDAQVTTPIASALVGAPRVKTVRGVSDFGASFVYVLFDDDTDLSWARSRTLEYLSTVSSRLPEGVTTALGPDASATGWVFQYALVDRSGTHSLADLRSYQDWYLKNHFKSVPGVAEVATVGGFVRQYQVNVDPNRLRAHGLSIQSVVEAVKTGNRDVGGRILESGERELIVRGRAYLRNPLDIAQTLIATTVDGLPIRVRDVAKVGVGSESRRGVADLNGTGDVVSGTVVMRQGENALNVIDRVKAKIAEIEPSLPPGMHIVPVYDRSDLVRRSLRQLRSTILEVMATVVAVILVFLWHIPSVAVPVVTLPLVILIAFIPLQLVGVGANVMSLGGIALAIGALVDAAIVLVEQTHRRLEEWNLAGRREELRTVILRGIKQVARPSFFALLVIAVSFLPILALQGEAGQLFKPLAYAKSLSMIVAAVLAITVGPALRLLFTRGTDYDFRPAWLSRIASKALVGEIRPERSHPLTRSIIRFYEPVVMWSLTHKSWIAAAVLVLAGITVPVWRSLGSEFMPPIDEGVLLYMPNTMPGISIAEAERLLQVTDRRLKQFPEVEQVLGKAGRADSATDPAPLSMFETLVVLRPASSWRQVPTWYSAWAPAWLKPALRRITTDRISQDALVKEMNDAVTIPGIVNTWSSPIKGRLDMLSTGVRSEIGIKITGASLEEIERVGVQLETVLRAMPGTRGVFLDRSDGGRYLDVRWNRTALADAGISLGEAQAVVQYAIGGDTATEIVHGRERYPVAVRYAGDFRSDPESIKRLLVQDASGARHVPLADLAEVGTTSGPFMMRNEGGLLAGYVYLDILGRDVEAYVSAADLAIRKALQLPAGVSLSWTGDYQRLMATRRELKVVIPLTLLSIVVLVYMNTRSGPKTLLVLLAVPFSALGAVWAVYLFGYQMSTAVWVGLLALLGVDAETGVFMLLYLDDAHDRAVRANRMNNPGDLLEATLEGASRRVRPKFMTTATLVVGLLPIMWSVGPGAAVMQRIAAPLIGGILTSFLLELLVYPALYHAWKSRALFGLSGTVNGTVGRVS